MFDGPRSFNLRRKISRALLGVDAFVDSSFYSSLEGAKEKYAAFSAYMDGFHISGWRRVLNELACESLTISIGFGVLALTLAVPAFQETSEDWLKKTDFAVTFLDSYGQEVGRRGIKHDDKVSFDDLPKNLVHAVIATEDRRFFEHFGIDVIGTFRALTVNAKADSVVQGGSSITQQLAKNLFLSNQRTLERKIKEAYLALWLEFHIPKREILRLYLDRAYLGGGAFGVQAASEFYFGKSVRDLSLAEAAMIAGLFKAPTRFAPHINLPAARARAADVLNNMVEAGYLNEGQIYPALRNPATPVDRSRDITPEWYLDYAFAEVKKLAEEKKLGDERVLTVRTALDTNLQRHAEQTLEDQLRQHGPEFKAKQGAMVVLDPLGALRAIVGGRDYGASQFNRATDALRQPGSSFKPFVYLTALETGKFKPSTIVVDGPICIGNWCPRNYKGSYAGRLPLVDALARSLNTVAVRLSVAIGEANPVPGHNNTWDAAKRGRAKIIGNARLMGLTTPLADTVSLPIGAAEVTVIDMASAFSTFANGGLRAPPYAAMEILNSRGEAIYRHDRDAPPLRQIIDHDIILTMVSMMTHVVEAGTGRRAHLDNTEVAGKTGTTNGYKDAWFIGYTGNYVGAVWYGNDDSAPMEKMTGGTLPAATWHDVMQYAHQGIELKPLPGRPALTAPRAPVAATAAAEAPRRPPSLSAATATVLTAIEAAMKASQTKSMDAAIAVEELPPSWSNATQARGGGKRSGRGRRMSYGTMATKGRGFALLGKFLSAAVAGILLGLIVTWVVVERRKGFGAIEAGPWTSWSRIGTPDADPYSRAILAYFGETVLGESEGISFVAYGDKRGAQFDPACDYVMKGEVPASRYWTLTLFSPAGTPIPNRAGRQGFTSSEVLRDGDGQFEITISRQARPGNWLPSGNAARFVLVLRLYDSELTKVMPVLLKGHCE